MWKAAVFEVRCPSRCQRIRDSAQTRGLATACWHRVRRKSALLRWVMYDNTAGAGNTAVGHRRVWTLLWERRRSNKRTVYTRAAALEMKSSSQRESSSQTNSGAKFTADFPASAWRSWPPSQRGREALALGYITCPERKQRQVSSHETNVLPFPPVIWKHPPPASH